MSIVPATSPKVPSWLDRLASVGWRVLATVGLGLAVLALCLVLSTTVLSLLLGFILAATLAPYARRLRARGWSGLKAAAGVTGGLLLAVFIGLALVFVALAPSIVALAGAASAQLVAAKDGPIVYGHHHLNVTGVDAHKKFYIELTEGFAAVQ